MVWCRTALNLFLRVVVLLLVGGAGLALVFQHHVNLAYMDGSAQIRVLLAETYH